MPVHESDHDPMMAKKGLSMAVHLFTALGMLLSFWALERIIQGDAVNALRLLALAAVIDSVDGTLARRVDVVQHTPEMDGGLIDNLVDYLSWVFVPLVFAWFFLGVPLLVSALGMMASVFGFAHIQAKTEDHYFRGFPSYWNFVVFYLFLFDAGVVVSSVIILLLAAMVLMPVKFIYPSRTLELRKTTLGLSLPYLLMMGFMLYAFTDTPTWLVVLSFYYPMYYVAVSWYLVRKKPEISTVH